MQNLADARNLRSPILPPAIRPERKIQSLFGGGVCMAGGGSGLYEG